MMTNGSNITIRPLQTWQEYLAAEELQRVVWQMPDWRDVVPAHLLVTAQKNGGIVLGAFDSNARLAGLAFGFLGVAEFAGRKMFKHCSHLLGVLPEYRGQQVGLRLKLKQREVALAQDIALITWTYDPLLARNANLNLATLGAIARHYIVNAYGEMTDALNAGLSSDRFEVEWWLHGPYVKKRVEHPERNAEPSSREASRNKSKQAESKDDPPKRTWDALIQAGAQEVLQIAFDAHMLPHIEGVSEPRGDVLLIEIPADLGAIKAAVPTLAREWRIRTRDVFQRAFTAGYIAADFIFAALDGRQRAAYVLTREPIDLATR